MFTKTMLRRLTFPLPRATQCYVVLGGIAYDIKALVASQAVTTHGPKRLWIVAGGPADHVPPAEVHQPRRWLKGRQP